MNGRDISFDEFAKRNGFDDWAESPVQSPVAQEPVADPGNEWGLTDEDFAPKQPSPVSQQPQQNSILGDLATGARALGTGLVQAGADQLPQAIGGMIEGFDVPLHDTGYVSQMIERNKREAQARQLSEAEKNREVFGVKAGTLEAGAANLGYSGAVMGPQFVAQKIGQIGGGALGTLVAPGPGTVAGGIVGGQALGMSVGYMTAKRADMNQILREKRDQLLQINPNMTEEEWASVKNQVKDAVVKHGRAEGLWEAAGNTLSLAIMGLGAKWGQKLTPAMKPALAKALGVVAGIAVDQPLEVASEAMTEIDQDLAEKEMGLRDPGPRLTFPQAVKNVGPQTLVTSAITMGLGGAAHAIRPSQPAAQQQAPAPEQVVQETADALQNDNPDALDEQMSSAVNEVNEAMDAAPDAQPEAVQGPTMPDVTPRPETNPMRATPENPVLISNAPGQLTPEEAERNHPNYIGYRSSNMTDEQARQMVRDDMARESEVAAIPDEAIREAPEYLGYRQAGMSDADAISAVRAEAAETIPAKPAPAPVQPQSEKTTVAPMSVQAPRQEEGRDVPRSVEIDGERWTTGSVVATELIRNEKADLRRVPDDILRDANSALSSVSFQLNDNDPRMGKVERAQERIEDELKNRKAIQAIEQPTEAKGAANGQVQGQAQEVAQKPFEQMSRDEYASFVASEGGHPRDIVESEIQTKNYREHIENAVNGRKPVSSQGVAMFKIKLPDGYSRSGKLFVYDPTTARKTSKEIFAAKKAEAISANKPGSTPTGQTQAPPASEAVSSPVAARPEAVQSAPIRNGGASISGKPRLAEDADALYKEIKKKSADGVVGPNGGILYPVVRVLGVGDMFMRGDEILVSEAKGTATRPATKSEIADFHDSIEKDTAQVLLMSQWSGMTKDSYSKPVRVLHSPSGNSFAKNPVAAPKPTSKQIFEQKRQKKQEAKGAMIDAHTDAHFSEWLNNNVAGGERQAVDNGIRAYIAKYPDVITKKGWSWPQVRTVAKREGFITEQSATAAPAPVSTPTPDVASATSAEKERYAKPYGMMDQAEKRFVDVMRRGSNESVDAEGIRAMGELAFGEWLNRNSPLLGAIKGWLVDRKKNKSFSSREDLRKYLVGLGYPEDVGSQEAFAMFVEDVRRADSTSYASPHAPVSTPTPDGKTVSVPLTAKQEAAVTPKEQKKYFLAEIDKAIEMAPEKAKPTDGWTQEDEARLKEAEKAEANAIDAYKAFRNQETPEGKAAAVAEKKANDIAAELRRQKARKSSEHVTIEVPGDGTFTVLNTKENLRAVQKKMASAFNKPGANTPSLPSGRATPIPKVEPRPPSMNKSLWDKILEPFTPQGKDNKKAREKLATPWYDKAKGEGYATDSRRAVFVTGLKISEPKAKNPLDRPLMSQVVPGYRAGQLPDVAKTHESVKIADTEAFARKLYQAFALVKETKSINETVVLYKMKDGTVAIEAQDPEIGEYKSGDVKKGKVIGAYNIPFLLDAVEFMRKTGNAEATLHYVDEYMPLLVTGAKEYVVQMPIRRASLPMDEAPLVAMHNLSGENLAFADRLGGLAMPSLGIANAKKPYTGFGEITMIAKPDLIDPARSGNYVADADQYSPRYPSARYFIREGKDSLVRETWKKIEQWAAQTYGKMGDKNLEKEDYNIRSIFYGLGSHLDTISFKDNGIDALYGDAALRAYFASQKYGKTFTNTRGGETNSTEGELRDFIDKHEREFKEWVDQNFGTFIDVKLFKGHTPAGKQRYAPYTMDEVMKELRKSIRSGEGENFFYGAGTVRAQFAKRYRSLSQIKQDRGRLVENIEEAKSERNNRMFEIAYNTPEAKRNERDFGYADRFWNAVMDAKRSRDPRAKLKEYGFDYDTMPWDEINGFIAELKAMPSEYFEAKPRRVVGLDEFAYAVVPKTATDETRSILTRNRIPMIEYDKAVAGDRERAIAEASELAGARFSLNGNAAPQLTQAKRRSLLTKMGNRYGKYAAFTLNKDGSFTMTAKRTGSKIRVEAVASLPKGEAGIWSPSRRTIQIANAGEIGHELTHAMRDMGMISDFEWFRLTKLARKANADSIAQIKARYAAAKYDLTEDDLNHELVAQYVNDVAEGKIDAGEGRTLVQKVVDFFKELARTLGVSAGSDVGLVQRTAEGAQMGLPGAARTGTMRGMKDRLAVLPTKDREAAFNLAYDFRRVADKNPDGLTEKWAEYVLKSKYGIFLPPAKLKAVVAAANTELSMNKMAEGWKQDQDRTSLPPDAQKRDAEYMAAVEKGDTATAQRIVDEAAKKHIIFVNANKPPATQLVTDLWKEEEGWRVLLKLGWEVDGSAAIFETSKSKALSRVKEARFTTRDIPMLRDPIVRDDQGRVIPLSERFNPHSDDIRYSLGTDYSTAKAEKTDEGWVLKGADGTPILSGFTSKRHAETYARLKSGKYLDAGVMPTERRGKTVYGIRVQNSKGKYVYDGHFFPTEEMAYMVLSRRQAAMDEAVEFLVGKDADKVVTVAEARKKLYGVLADQIEAGENADKVKADAAEAIKQLVRSLGKDIDAKTLRPLSEKVYAMLTDKSMSSVERRMGAINRFISGIVLERARRSVRKDMGGMLDAATKPKMDSKTLQLKDPDFRYAVNAVNHIRARADWTLEQIEQENEALLDSDPNNEMKPDDGQPPTVVGEGELSNEDKIALNLNFAGYGIEMDFTRLAEMRENLETLMGDKSAQAKAERKAKSEFFDNEAEEFAAMLGGKRKGNALENNERAAPVREKMKKLLQGFHGNIASGQYAVEMLDQESNVDPTNRKNVSVERREHASRSKEATGMDPPREAVLDILARAFGLNPKNKMGDNRKLVKKLTEMKRFQKETGVYAFYPKTDKKGKIVRDEDGKPVEFTKGEKSMSGSRENFIYVYALKRRAESEAGQVFSNDPEKIEGFNNSLMRRLVLNGYSEQTMDQVEKFIGQEGIDIAEGLNDWVQKNVSPKVRAILIKKYGIAPPMFDFYVPIANKIVKGDQDVTGGAQTGMDKMVYGWMKRASFNQYDFKPSSIIDLYMKHAAEVNHVDAWHDTVEYERRVFKNRKLQDAIEDVLGGKFRRHLNEHVKRISMGSEAIMHSQMENWFIKKFSVSVIHNPTQFFKQMAAAPMPLAFAPPGASKTAMFAKGTANMFLNLPSRFRWAQMMYRESPVFRDRYEKGMSIPMRIAESTKHGDMVKTMNIRSLFHWMTNFTKYGDMASALWAGPELYQSWFDYAKKQGMSDADAKKEAIFRVDQAIEKGLQSSHAEHLSSAQTGKVQKFFQLFNTQQVAMTRKWVSTWRDILKGRGSKLDNASKLVAIHLSQAMWQLAADAFGAGLSGDDGEDEWERMKHNQIRTALLLPIGGYAVTYSLLERFLKEWQKEPVMGEFFGDAIPSSAPFETAETATKILARFLNDELTEADVNRLQSAGAELAGLALGTPVAPAVRWGKGIADAATNTDLSLSQRAGRAFGYGKMAVGESTRPGSAKPKKSGGGMFDAYRPNYSGYQYKNPYGR